MRKIYHICQFFCWNLRNPSLPIVCCISGRRPIHFDKSLFFNDGFKLLSPNLYPC